MITATIRVRETLTAAMAAAGAQASPERCAKLACRFAEASFKSHFDQLARTRHREGMAHTF